MKQAISAYLHQTRTRFGNQPVLCNESKMSFSMKQRKHLIGLKLTTDRFPPLTSQTPYPMRHVAPLTYLHTSLPDSYI